MDANKTHREKGIWEIHKNVTSYFEPILETVPHETTALRLQIYPLKNYPRRTRHAGYCWIIKDKRASDDRLARTYLYQHCANTGSSLENLPKAMDNSDGWRNASCGNPCCLGDLMIMGQIEIFEKLLVIDRNT